MLFGNKFDKALKQLKKFEELAENHGVEVNIFDGKYIDGVSVPFDETGLYTRNVVILGGFGGIYVKILTESLPDSEENVEKILYINSEDADYVIQKFEKIKEKIIKLLS